MSANGELAETLDTGRLVPPVYLPVRRVLAVTLGNALEFYDFITFAYFAIQIGHTFFPESQTSHGLLFSLASFGVGFVARPLGSIVIGRYADRVGRKPAMLWSFGMMGGGIIGLALIPSYAQIGIAAPILLVVFRLLQGFALGGEVGPSTAYLVEAAPPHRRGLYVSLQVATQNVAGLAAGIVGFALADLLSPAQLDAWGWRLAFLIGTAVVPVGLYIRRRLPETLQSVDRTLLPPAPARAPRRLIVLGLMMVAAGATSSYVIDYINTYVQDTLKLGTHLAFGASIVEGLLDTCAAPISGLLSDRFGRKPVMLSAVGLLLVCVIPCFVAMSTWRSVTTVYGATALLSALAAAMIAAALVTIAESLPRSVRSTAFGTVYAVSVAVFGGFAQFNIKWLLDLTGNPVAPAWYLATALVLGGVAMTLVRESAPCKVRRETPNPLGVRLSERR
jgi:MHS family citrate/tricarballylate:H+ symporter-like MFS transporter